MSEDFFRSVGGRLTVRGNGDNAVATWNFGLVDPRDRTAEARASEEAFLATLPEFRISGAWQLESRRYALWQAGVRLLGRHLPYNYQTTGSCFPAGTPVLMCDGNQKPVERVVVGDHVVTHLGQSRRVSGVNVRNHAGEMVTLKCGSGGHAVEATADHMFAVWDERDQDFIWVPAEYVNEGDQLIYYYMDGLGKDYEHARTPYGNARKVTRVFRRNVTDLPVYDIEVEEDHSFFAGNVVVHNCVGAGGGNMAKTLMAVEIVLGNEPEEYKELWWPFTYGRSRSRSGSSGRGEGSTGEGWAEAATQDGLFGVFEGDSLPPFKDDDGWIKLPESVELEWSDGRAFEKYLPVARNHLVKNAARMKSADDCVAALANGYPITQASMFGFAPMVPNPVGDPPVRMVSWNGSWSHQTYVDEYWDHPTQGEIFRWGNNWGGRAHGKALGDEPDSSVYISKATMDRICKTGAVFAFSGLNGFVARKVDFTP